MNFSVRRFYEQRQIKFVFLNYYDDFTDDLVPSKRMHIYDNVAGGINIILFGRM